MSDPYQVLGVSRDSTDEQIKTAYRELARKYHPDNYQDTPLSDLASEKMKEINAAYDEVQADRKAGGGRSQQNAYGAYQGARPGGYQNAGYGNSYTGYSPPSQFADIRRMISQNRIVEAEELLDGVPAAKRDAEWYFLKGSVFYSRGWLDEAMTHFAHATQMSPNNPEYRAAYQRSMYQRNTGSPYGGQQYGSPSMGGCSCCDLCAGLMCFNMCCDCSNGCC